MSVSVACWKFMITKEPAASVFCVGVYSADDMNQSAS
jgi:hypothetical protein